MTVPEAEPDSPGRPADLLSLIDVRGATHVGDLLPVPDAAGEQPVAAVREIIEMVRNDGDEALIGLTKRFDGVSLDRIRVTDEEVAAGLDGIDEEVRASLMLAAGRIRAHHVAQLRGEVSHESDGVRVTSTTRPVGSAGCYVPGGRAAYPSTLLMTAIPAKVAGVERVVVCVPPDAATGRVAGVTLAAAAIAGVDEVYQVGGAQAIAALAYGTQSVGAVDVVCGPGNLYVAVAKREVASQVGVAAAFAGPSEVVVVADRTVDPDLVAIDLMLQAEHGPDGLAWLVSWEISVIEAVGASLARLVEAADRRRDIESTLARSGYAVLVDSGAMALQVTDAVAPEHLELLCSGAEDMAAEVRNAGAVFCGPWSPASIGDYIAGPSHVLPTHRSARFSSALGVDDFTKHIHVVTATRDGLATVGPATVALAEAEGLNAHADSVRMRLEQIHHGAPGAGGGS